MDASSTNRQAANAAIPRNARRFGRGSRFVREDAAPAIAELRAGVDSTLRVAALGSFAMTSGAVVALLLPVALFLGMREYVEPWAAVLIALGISMALGSVAGVFALRGLRRIARSPRRAWDRARHAPPANR